MSTSAKSAFYVLGGITTLVAVCGAICLAMIFIPGPSLSRLNTATGPYTAHFFMFFSLINVAFLTALGVAAIRLFKLDLRGVRLLVIALKAELIYWLLLIALWLMPNQVASSAAGATGVGNMGISPQLFIAYPLTGLIAIWALRRFGVLEVQPGAGADGPKAGRGSA